MISLADLLRELVAIPSESGSEGEIANYVLDRLREWRIDAERIGNTVVARAGSAGGGTGPRLLLCSHLDTVPAGEGWTRAPRGESWDSGRLHGRGSNDAKASVAAMMHAARRYLGNASRPAGELQLAFTEREETSNTGIAAALAHLGAPGAPGLPDAAIIGEPTGLEVARAQSGLAVLEAAWSGTACHAAHVARENPANALLLASADLARTAPYVELPGRHALLGSSRVVATVARAGERHNCIPGRAEAVFDARLAPPHTGEDAAAALRARMPNATVAIRSDRLRPVETAEDHPLVRAALAAAGRARAVGSGTMSDMALLAGIPAVKCGPGESARSHTADEYVWEAELAAGARFYEAAIPAALAALAQTSSVE
jgi:acetylornithine deacetylase